MALVGVGASFLPQEMLAYADLPAQNFPVVLIQIIGALYLGFGLLNWNARGMLFGGIYGRPIILGNFMHFAVVTIALVKFLSVQTSPLLLAGAAAYIPLSVWFGLVLFTHPLGSAKPGTDE